MPSAMKRVLFRIKGFCFFMQNEGSVGYKGIGLHTLAHIHEAVCMFM